MQERSFIRAEASVLGLVVSTAALAVAGVLAFGPDPASQLGLSLKQACVIAFAGVIGFALWVSMAATQLAAILKGRAEHQVALKLAVGVAILCGMVSVAGAHLGFAVFRGAPESLPAWWAVDLGGLGLGFVKPAMAFVIQAGREVSRAEIAANEAHEAAEARAAADRSLAADAAARAERLALAAPAPAQIAAPSPAPKPKPKPKVNRGARVAMAAAAVLTPAAAGVAFADQAPAPISQTEIQAKPTGYRPSVDEIEQAREQLHRRGIVCSTRTVAAQIGCSRQALSKVWPKGVPLAFNAE